MILTIPMPLPSAANLREHHMVRARRVKKQRQTVAAYIGGRPKPALPVVVTLERVSARALDGDNLQSAFKAVRDEVAKWLGHADNVPGITWEYGQRRGGVGELAVVIRVGPRP